MKAFHTIAVPHRDILQGKLTMDTFAADLWEAFHNRGVAEYRDAALFFQKTYPTEGLSNLLQIIEKRLIGKGGDPVIQIQTPFGGGKTHSLIALMHKAKEWGANRVVIVGTNLSPKETLWGIMEKQLTGKEEKLTEPVAPGKEKIKSLLSQYQPAVILIDELLEYVVKAGGVKVGDSTLAAQTLAFMQELTESVATLEKVCLVVTLPASLIEHYDEKAEKFLIQLQKVSGRIEKIYTPVNEHEIARVIRRRLFSDLKEEEARQVVNKFVQYAQEENILPAGIEPIEYRDRFFDSYPFMPEVIDVLYHRWGSFPSFQRTRGVLRILSLVIYSLKSSNLPYISLADFDLANQEIRQELIKHIGNEYNSILAQDIISADSGSKKIDISLGESYHGLNLATRAATTIFMYSFSGGPERGATLTEIKRCATTLSNSAAVVSDAIEQLKSKLFYTQFQNDKYFFSNTPNLNRIIHNKMENISTDELIASEKELIKNQIDGKRFKVLIWEENSANIPDSEDLKLVILREEKEDVILQIIRNKGNTPRVYCNTIFFLCPVTHEYEGFINSLRRYLAYENLLLDQTIALTERQKKETKDNSQKEKNTAIDLLFRAYQCLLIPSREKYEKDYLGIPAYGDKAKLDERVYEKLKNNKILENISPLVINQKYIARNTYVMTKNLLEMFYKTPGEIRLASKEVLKKAIMEGVDRGDFGLGDVIDGNIVCKFYKKQSEVTFSDTEAIIAKNICEEQIEKEIKDAKRENFVAEPEGSIPYREHKEESDEKSIIQSPYPIKNTLRLNLYDIPKGKLSDIMRMISGLQSKFNKISLTINASDGGISEQDFENSILETIRQLGIKYKEDE